MGYLIHLHEMEISFAGIWERIGLMREEYRLVTI